jgi:serine/threonine-protein kinase
VIKWAKQITEALIYLHSSKPNPVIYRDMKPSNLILNKDGKIVIVDFGIAREYKQESKGDTTHMGTIGYAAPEQFGGRQTDARTDIYSLGVTLYHLATGKGPNAPPYDLRPIREVKATLSVGLEYIIAKCTKADPEQRYQSAAALLDDLVNIHKFDKAYKKKVLTQRTLAALLVASIFGFSYLTWVGFKQIRQEKIDQYNSLISKGVNLMNSRQYQDALTVFGQAIAEMPETMDGYKDVAHTYLNKGDYDQCISYINDTVLANVKNAIYDAEIYYILGTAYFEKQDYKNAEISLARASEINLSNTLYRRDLAVSLAREGKLEAAEVQLNNLKNKGSDEDVTWYVSGELARAQKKMTEAENDFMKCLNMTQSDELKRKAYISLAENYKDEKSTQGNSAINKEITILERAKSDLKASNDIVLTEMLGAAYYDGAVSSVGNKTEYYNNAIKNFNLLISLGYSRPYIYRNIAIINQQMGNYSDAEKCLLQMKKLFPEDYTCYLQLAFLYADIENTKPNEQRNYQRTYDNYLLAVKYCLDGDKNPEIQPLINLINELRSKNWIK